MRTFRGEGAMISAGYFVTRTIERPSWPLVGPLPERILTLSDCLAPFLPHTWAVPWTGDTAEQRALASASLGVEAGRTEELYRWTDKALEENRMGWPNVLFALEDAEELEAQFHGRERLCVLGAAVSNLDASRILEGERTPGGVARDGWLAALARADEPAPSGRSLGWEVLGYDLGGVHSWVCNGLERDVAKEREVRLDSWGLIPEQADADWAAAYCQRPDVGAEPGVWFACRLTDYSRK